MNFQKFYEEILSGNILTISLCFLTSTFLLQLRDQIPTTHFSDSVCYDEMKDLWDKIFTLITKICVK